MSDIEQEGPARPYPDWAYDDGYSERKGVAVPLLIGGVVQFFVSLVSPPLEFSAAQAAVPRDLAASAGEAAGAILISIGLIGIILYAAFFRTRDPRGVWKIPVVLLPVALVATLLATAAAGASNNAEQMRLARRSIAETARHYVESEGRDPGPLRHSGATGEAGEVERLVLNLYGDLSRRKRQYEQNLNGLLRALEADQLRGPRDAARAADQHAGLPDTVRAFLADVRQIVPRARRDFARSNLSQATGEEFLGGLEQGFAQANARNSRLYDLEIEAVEATLELLAVLRRTNWNRDQSGNYVFTSTDELREFEGAHNRLARIGTEQERLIAEHQREALRRIRNLERTN